MAKWVIDLPVAEEDAALYDKLANAVDEVFKYAADFKPSPNADMHDWLNGLLAGLAELSNVSICPEEYNSPLETQRQAALRLASLLILYSLATSYSMKKNELAELQPLENVLSSTTENESTT